MAKSLLTLAAVQLSNGNSIHICKGPGKQSLRKAVFEFPEGRKRHTVTFYTGTHKFKATISMVRVVEDPKRNFLRMEADVNLIGGPRSDGGHYQYHVVAQIRYCSHTRKGSVIFTEGQGTVLGSD